MYVTVIRSDLSMLCSISADLEGLKSTEAIPEYVLLCGQQAPFSVKLKHFESHYLRSVPTWLADFRTLTRADLFG